jgi:hypothetical protein
MSAGIEDSESRELASWVLEQPYGAIGMLYTQVTLERAASPSMPVLW